MVLAIAIGREDHEEVGLLIDRQPRIVVGRQLRDKVAEDLGPLLDERRPQAPLEELDPTIQSARPAPVEIDGDEPGVRRQGTVGLLAARSSSERPPVRSAMGVRGRSRCTLWNSSIMPLAVGPWAFQAGPP